MSLDLDSLRAAVAEHGAVCRVVVARTQGSAPREAGACMLVWRDGAGWGQSGTIGGGTLEYEAAQAARKQLDSPGTSARIRRLPLGPALGQCCGGAVVLLSEVFDASTLPEPDPAGIFARPTRPGAPMPMAVKRILTDARVPAASLIGDWMIEPVAPGRAPLWIFGAGHVGRALVDVITPLPHFVITWIDTAPERFPPDVPASVTVLPASAPDRVVPHAPKHAHHLILTYSHGLDLDLCHALLSHDFASAGLIGSASKWARFQKRLAGLGHAPERISRITCPIGDPGLGKHPQAIAIGVAQALISLQNGSQHPFSNREQSDDRPSIRSDRASCA